jgi:hypothetical protein
MNVTLMISRSEYKPNTLHILTALFCLVSLNWLCGMFIYTLMWFETPERRLLLGRPTRVWELTNSMDLFLVGKPPVAPPLKNFPTFYVIGTRKFITSVHNWCLLWDRCIQPILPNPVPILMLSYVEIFLVVSVIVASEPKSLLHSSSPRSLHMLRHSHPPWFGNSNYI